MEPPELDFSPHVTLYQKIKKNLLFETVFCDRIRHWKIFHTVPNPVVITRFRNLQIKFLRAMQLQDSNCYNIFFLIVVLPCMLTITKLLLQQNAHFYY
jgi:hypothetical protein